jgi:hypothetical protein
MPGRKNWTKTLDRTEGSMTEAQRFSIEKRIPAWTEAGTKHGLLHELTIDWTDCSQREAQQLIYGMSAVTKELEARPVGTTSGFTNFYKEKS